MSYCWSIILPSSNKKHGHLIWKKNKKKNKSLPHIGKKLYNAVPKMKIVVRFQPNVVVPEYWILFCSNQTTFWHIFGCLFLKWISYYPIPKKPTSVGCLGCDCSMNSFFHQHCGSLQLHQSYPWTLAVGRTPSCVMFYPFL